MAGFLPIDIRCIDIYDNARNIMQWSSEKGDWRGKRGGTVRKRAEVRIKSDDEKGEVVRMR